MNKAITALFLVLSLVLVWGSGISAQEEQLQGYLERIDTAQQMRNYNQALRLLQEAQQKFPHNPLIWLLSGELYEQQNLLSLSLESYQKASELEPQNTFFLRRIALIQDQLGRYADAVESYQQIENFGNSIEQNEARRKKGWLLYKLHRFGEAEESILAIPPEERSSSIMMTLAIIYSAAYDYEKSRKAYEQSITLTYLKRGYSQSSVNQRALIYYNYALLETDFMHFDLAMELNEKSIKSFSFPSNELLRGELYLQQRKFVQARKAFLKSQQLEEISTQPSPLALLDLVQLSIDQGSYQEGMVFFNELKKRFQNQTEWMSSYGTDPTNFELELTKLLTSLYKGLLQEARWFLPLNTRERLQSSRAVIKYSWLYWFSSARLKLLSYQVGKDHYRQGNSLNANQKLLDASDTSSRIYRHFFSRLRSEHLKLIPESKGKLLLEEAMIDDDPKQVEQSLELLNPKWELEEMETAYVALSKLLPQKRYQYIIQAYQLNHGVLKKEGVSLPLQIQISGSSAYRSSQKRLERKLRSYLGHMGIEPISAERIGNETKRIGNNALTLQIQWGSKQVKAYLLSQKGTVLRSIDSRDLEAIEEDLSWSAQKTLLKRFARSFMQQVFA